MLYLFEDFALDMGRRELRQGAEAVPVEPLVFDLLAFLIQNRNRVVTQDDLLAGVWSGRIVSESAMRSRMNAARAAIGDSGEEQRLIRTMARKGFRFIGQVSESADVPSHDMSAAVPDKSAAVRKKILLVDDHALIREALRGLLRELRKEAMILEAANARQALRSIEENPEIELILLDLKLPDRDGFEVLAELRERYPVVSIVVLSASDRRDDVAKALDLGALGFIPKSASREVMLSAFNLIFAGGIYVPPEILGLRTPKP